MFAIGQKVVSGLYPEFGTGEVKTCKVRSGKFTNTLYKTIFVVWPQGMLTVHTFFASNNKVAYSRHSTQGTCTAPSIDWQLKTVTK